MTIVWLDRARASLLTIGQYIAEDNPLAAYETLVTIEASVSALAQHPEMGRPGRVRGTREWQVTGTPYLIAYRVKGKELQVLHVLHGVRKWPEGF